MNKIIFELTFNDIHKALEAYVKENTIKAFDIDVDDKNIFVETYIAFVDKDGKQLNVEFSEVVVKLIK